ncbi:MAG: hypothetical protein ACK5TH_13765, partial [Prosthecobacter sp.]
MTSIRQLVDFYLHGRHRLEALPPLALGCSVADAVKLYGEPVKSEPSDDSPEITQHMFAAGAYHEVVASEWNEIIQSITYWSAKADPVRDLQFMLNAYGDSSDWDVMEEGYWYQRKDGAIRLWCSAIPAIGVAYVDFLRAKSGLKTAHDLSKLELLPDITWAPNNVIFELQRLFVEDGNSALAAFASRSDMIAVSPEGRSVFIVRNHHAYDVDEGFMELNWPPEPEKGYASQVINCFSWSSGGSSWTKITLPRNAEVERLCFVGEKCLLQIQDKERTQTLRFEGFPNEIIR